MTKNTLLSTLVFSMMVSSCATAPQKTEAEIASQEPSVVDVLTDRAIAQAQGLEVYGVRAITRLLETATTAAAKQELNTLIRQSAQQAGIKLVSGKSIVSQLDDAAANKVLKQLFASNPGLRQNAAYAEVESGLEAAIRSRSKTGVENNAYVDSAKFRKIVGQINEGLGNHVAKQDVIKSQIAVHHHTSVEMISDATMCPIFKKFDTTAAANNVALYKSLATKAREIGQRAVTVSQKAAAMIDEGACSIARFMSSTLSVPKQEVIPTAETLVGQCKSFNPVFVQAMKKPSFSTSCSY